MWLLFACFVTIQRHLFVCFRAIHRRHFFAWIRWHLGDKRGTNFIHWRWLGGYRVECTLLLQWWFQTKCFEQVLDEVQARSVVLIFDEKENMGATFIGASQVKTRIMRVVGAWGGMFVSWMMMSQSEWVFIKCKIFEIHIVPIVPWQRGANVKATLNFWLLLVKFEDQNPDSRRKENKNTGRHG